MDHGVDSMTRQKAAGNPFFLYVPIFRTHFPNLPSKRFEGASRIGQFGVSLMEGDAIVGKMLDSLGELGLERDTIVVFASDNGPDGPGARAFGGDLAKIPAIDRLAAFRALHEMILLPQCGLALEADSYSEVFETIVA